MQIHILKIYNPIFVIKIKKIKKKHEHFTTFHLLIWIQFSSKKIYLIQFIKFCQIFFEHMRSTQLA